MADMIIIAALAYRHYMLTASDGSSQQVYCVESGIAYNTSDNTYTSESGTNSNYLNLLPAEARRGTNMPKKKQRLS